MILGGLLETLRDIPAHRELLAALSAGRKATAAVPDAAKAVVISTLWSQMDRPLLVVCPRPERARRLVEQLFVYLGDDASVHHFVESEVLPYERMTVDRATLHQRLGALGALRRTAARSASGPPTVPLVVASVAALLQKTIAPELLERLAHTVRVGERFALEPTLSQWVRMGYRLTPAVDEVGTASRRGGIVDVYTPGAPMPARIELWGDRVDSIRLFDLGTQRSVEEVDSIAVLPAAEVLPSFVDRHRFDEAARRLDFSGCKTAARDHLHEELAELVAGISEDASAFFAGFFNSHTLLDHLGADGECALLLDERGEIEEAALHSEEGAQKLRLAKEERGDLPINFPSSLQPWGQVSATLERWNAQLELTRYHQPSGVPSVTAPFGPPPSYHGQIEELTAQLADADRGPAAIVTQHSQRVAEILREAGIGVHETSFVHDESAAGVVDVVHASGIEGWTLYSSVEAQEALQTPLLTVLTDAEVFGVAKRRPGRTRTTPRHALELNELVPGQHLVHIDHGVARFLGPAQMETQGALREYLVLQYAEGDKLYVPLEHLDRVSIYQGGGEEPPALTRLGSQDWARTVNRVKESVKQLAFDLLQLYAQRELVEGHAFAPDSPWQQQMEDAFPYMETPDQAEAIALVKADMEALRPMDRLVCGDVGYGKTEVAVRATFKAVLDSKQTAILAPTTVLVQQHYETFTERFRGFPIRVESLSRFRTGEEQAKVVAALKQGEVDVVIGTHRLLQKDVGFKDLGLVIIDEEHRFGVGHKEMLKEMSRDVNVLTMTATPIPRTLHMAMAGIRDISTMETPPEHRLPIRTYLAEASDDLVREAILRELDRGGQVFYLHNRVKSMDLAADHLRSLVPEATFLVAHGRMPEGELAEAMARFADGEADVLLCTTIIESGLDLPSVNTLIVERADRFGLAQLYQLRGRIGRRSQRAYAYLLAPQGRRITDAAQRRLQTILAATELGAGFRVAMKDLEIRGAGNILGPEQSGYIHAVGYELYARLLAEAVERLREERDSSTARSTRPGAGRPGPTYRPGSGRFHPRVARGAFARSPGALPPDGQGAPQGRGGRDDPRDARPVRQVARRSPPPALRTAGQGPGPPGERRVGGPARRPDNAQAATPHRRSARAVGESPGPRGHRRPSADPCSLEVAGRRRRANGMGPGAVGGAGTAGAVPARGRPAPAAALLRRRTRLFSLPLGLLPALEIIAGWSRHRRTAVRLHPLDDFFRREIGRRVYEPMHGRTPPLDLQRGLGSLRSATPHPAPRAGGCQLGLLHLPGGHLGPSGRGASSGCSPRRRTGGCPSAHPRQQLLLPLLQPSLLLLQPQQRQEERVVLLGQVGKVDPIRHVASPTGWQCETRYKSPSYLTRRDPVPDARDCGGRGARHTASRSPGNLRVGFQARFARAAVRACRC